MKKVINFVGKTAKWLIFVFFAVIVAVLTLQSIFSTVYMSAAEKNYYAADKPIRHFVVFILLVTVMLAIRMATKKMKKRELLDRIGMWLLLALSVTIGFVIFYTTQLYPRSDQRLVLLSAAQLREGDLSSMEPGGYLAIWSHQMGAVLYHYFLSFLVGVNNHVGMQIWNVVMLGVFQITFWLLAREFFNKISRTSMMFGIISFVPLTFYVSFIYGNIAGLAFSTMAIFCLVRFTKTRRYLWMVLSVLTLWISILIKGNYLIILIAMGIYLLVDYLTSHQKKALGFLVLLVVCYLSSNLFIHAATKQITGRDVPQGVPMIGWVAMGLQDGIGGKGWYNLYVRDIYDEFQGDRELMTEDAKEKIRESIDGFVADPVLARQFFSEKIASQWNNPTFQCFWIYYDRTTDIQVPALMKNILTGSIRNKLISLFNLWQTQILFGVCLYLVYRFRKSNWQELLLALCFVGGFLFHLFLWEAKGQYTLSYFVLLIPYAMMGFHEFIGELENALHGREHGLSLGDRLLHIAGSKVTYIVLGMLLVILVGTVYQGAWFTDTIKITRDNDRFQEKVTEVEVEY